MAFLVIRTVSYKCRSLPTRRKSIPATDSPNTFSGQISSSGPVYKPVHSVPISSMTLAQTSFSPPHPINSPWSEALEKLNLNHSFEHNYEDKLSKIKMNYRALLDQLSAETPNHNPWGTVKIIDFAHAWFNTDEEMAVDHNFREGIENLVAIFEEFLKETDDQVF
ncbi:inositol polyphosphate multikinase [Phthorimaea operculella]|nr:inositol polyphosphate multikinase [Phthorimaea operculella]